MQEPAVHFIHLRTHSQYSILDGTASAQDLAERAAQEKMRGLGLTDHGNLYGVVEFYKACKEAGIQSIIGCEFYVAPESRMTKSKIEGMRPGYQITLIARNQKGYQNLCKLSSLGFLEGFYYFPRIDRSLLSQYSDGLFCISGGMGSRLAHEILYGTSESAAAQLTWEKELFGPFYYLDLQRHQMSQEELKEDGYFQESWLLQKYQDFVNQQAKLNTKLVELGLEKRIPLVATNDVHYLERLDWRAHEVLLNIQSGEPCEVWEKDSLGNLKSRKPNPKRDTYPSHAYYFKSPGQMGALFADCPDALANSVKIADQCRVAFDFKAKHYPVFVPPSLEGTSWTKEEREKEVERFLRQLCEDGMAKRYTPDRLAKIQELYPNQDPMQIVRTRLEEEMNVIVPKGMADYLLIVWDFIYWAKQQGIPMGPGRGSGVGSIVLYLIEVTDIEPLRFHLFFERFINPERISYPDIDVDICMERRNEVIDYTLRKYGKENVAQIITFGTMKAKMALRDVGRVLSIPLAKVNEIAKLVPEDLNITLDKALEKDPELRSLYERDEEVARLVDLAKKLEGCIRNTGVHAAGMIISGSPLTDLIPICNAKDSSIPITQFSMKPVESVGMLKVDFLGLTTLTAIQVCIDAVAASRKTRIDWINLPLNDKSTFDLLNQGKTLGIFQLESGGMQDLSRQLHLDRFEEIIAVGALYRPGPMDMIPSFINRKHGKEPIENEHPWMQDILAETYGIMVYQEQVMQIASKLAGFSLGEGDVLRRAMGKKDMEQMATQREKFRSGAQLNQIEDVVSMAIFDKMEKFAAYGFNKSHATAYGYLSYVTAYLKANYPKEWMAALMTCSRDDLTKVAKFIRECQNLSIAMLPPDVNESGETFQATLKGIRFAMSGIKGVGSGVVEAILQERAAKGPFNSLYSFCARIDMKKVGKKVIASLIEAGCFDFTGWERDALLIALESCYETAAKEKKERAQGVLSLFSLIGVNESDSLLVPPHVNRPTPVQEMLFKEKMLLGFFLTGHPMDQYRTVLQRLSCVPLRRMNEMGHESVVRSAFIVEGVQVRFSSKNQKKFAILTISDGIESMELPIWSELYEEKSSLLQENQLLYAVLQIDQKDDEMRLSCKWLDDLTKADEEMIRACDQAYDQAKYQAAKYANQRALSPVGQSKGAVAKPDARSPAKDKEKAMTKQLAIRVDMGTVRLSHIVQLKKLFAESRGSTPVVLHFMEAARLLAALQIDASWGVVPSPDLKKAVGSVASVLEYKEDYTEMV